MKRLFLVRHGQATVGGETYDRLSDLGRLQMRRLADYWGNGGGAPEAVARGPLVRQRQSADELLGGLERHRVVVGPALELAEWSEHQGLETVEHFSPILAADEPRLAEWVASLEHLNGNDRIRRYFEIYRDVSARWVRGELDLEGTGLESWSDFRARVRSGLDALRERLDGTGSAAVVTSAGAIASTVGDLLDLSERRVLELSWVIRNSAVTELRELGGRLTLLSLNGIPHLGEGEDATFV